MVVRQDRQPWRQHPDPVRLRRRLAAVGFRPIPRPNAWPGLGPEGWPGRGGRLSFHAVTVLPAPLRPVRTPYTRWTLDCAARSVRWMAGRWPAGRSGRWSCLMSRALRRRPSLVSPRWSLPTGTSGSPRRFSGGRRCRRGRRSLIRPRGSDPEAATPPRLQPLVTQRSWHRGCVTELRVGWPRLPRCRPESAGAGTLTL